MLLEYGPKKMRWKENIYKIKNPFNRTKTYILCWYNGQGVKPWKKIFIYFSKILLCHVVLRLAGGYNVAIMRAECSLTKWVKLMSQFYSAMCQGIFAKLICTGVLFRGVLQFILYFPKDQSVSIASLLITNFFTGSWTVRGTMSRSTRIVMNYKPWRGIHIKWTRVSRQKSQFCWMVILFNLVKASK